MKYFFVCLALILGFGCSRLGSTAHPRSDAFYQPLINARPGDAKDLNLELEGLKVLQSDTGYSLRLALFSNHSVYYQIDRLGDGWGTWILSNGALSIVAERKYFDMTMVLSGAEAQGEAVVLRFFDRFGYQEQPIEFLDSEQTQKFHFREFVYKSNGY